jgi:hypothetical protein
VPVPPLDLGRLAAVLYDDQAAQLAAAAERLIHSAGDVTRN